MRTGRPTPSTVPPRGERRGYRRLIAAPSIDLTIERVVAGGDGLARADDGRVVFVASALPGERVRVALVEERRDFARARLLDVLEPSPIRQTPPCRFVAAGCGGCGWQHVQPAAQVELKLSIVRGRVRPHRRAARRRRRVRAATSRPRLSHHGPSRRRVRRAARLSGSSRSPRGARRRVPRRASTARRVADPARARCRRGDVALRRQHRRAPGAHRARPRRRAGRMAARRAAGGPRPHPRNRGRSPVPRQRALLLPDPGRRRRSAGGGGARRGRW